MEVVISNETHVCIRNEENNLIIDDNNVLLQNKFTGETLYVPLTAEVKEIFQITEYSEENDNFEHNEDSEDEEQTVNDNKLWTTNSTLFLIDQVEKNQDSFDKGLKKNVWLKIAKACSESFKPVTAVQCDTKWKALKRTYKSIQVHNKTTGKARKHWEFYNRIDSFMSKKPEINPIATCSSMKGLTGRQTSKQQNKSEDSEDNDDANGKSSEPSSSCSSSHISESSFSRKRRQRASAASKRHDEKMARMDRFNTLFEKMLEKL